MSKESENTYLTESLAREFNISLGGKLSDEILLMQLTRPKSGYEMYDFPKTQENIEFLNYLKTKDLQSRRIITNSIRTTYRHLPAVKKDGTKTQDVTVGEIRRIGIRTLYKVKGLGPDGVNFLKKAFAKLI